MRAIVSVIGKDQVGIIANVCSLLSSHQVNVLDISQTVLQDYFTMIMVVDTSACSMDFAALVKRTLDAQDVRYTPGKGSVSRVALLGGAGGEAIYPAAEVGADALITGEVKHNLFREAAQLGIAVCEAGHYDTEKVFRTHLHMCLQKEFFALQYNIKVEESEIEAAPYRAV